MNASGSSLALLGYQLKVGCFLEILVSGWIEGFGVCSSWSWGLGHIGNSELCEQVCQEQLAVTRSLQVVRGLSAQFFPRIYSGIRLICSVSAAFCPREPQNSGPFYDFF